MNFTTKFKTPDSNSPCFSVPMFLKLIREHWPKKQYENFVEAINREEKLAKVFCEFAVSGSESGNRIISHSGWHILQNLPMIRLMYDTVWLFPDKSSLTDSNGYMEAQDKIDPYVAEWDLWYLPQTLSKKSIAYFQIVPSDANLVI